MASFNNEMKQIADEGLKMPPKSVEILIESLKKSVEILIPVVEILIEIVVEIINS